MRSTIQMLLAYAKAMWSALTVGVRRSRVPGAAVVVWTAADKSATEKRKPRAILTMRQMRMKGAGTHLVYIWLLFLLYRAPCPLSRSCWFKSHRSTGTLAQGRCALAAIVRAAAAFPNSASRTAAAASGCVALSRRLAPNATSTAWRDIILAFFGSGELPKSCTDKEREK